MLKIDNNIAQTGLRVLFILQLLMKGPISKSQILSEISKSLLLKNVASDTITLDINTLKSVGFDILTGNKGNNYCYELKINPIKVKLTKKEIKSLLITKKAMFHFMDFKYIISVYQTFKKLSVHIESKENAESLLNFGNILKTNFEILRELDVHARHNNEIVVFYNSPSGKSREIKLICTKLEYSRKNDKLYLWGECEEYGSVYLRCDHIKKIIKILRSNVNFKPETKKCVYSITKRRNVSFDSKNEKIIKITPDCIKIREDYTSDFHLKQKLLSYGNELIEVEDEKIKGELINIIQGIEEMYI